MILMRHLNDCADAFMHSMFVRNTKGMLFVTIAGHSGSAGAGCVTESLACKLLNTPVSGVHTKIVIGVLGYVTSSL